MRRFTPKIIAPPHSTLPFEVVMVESDDGELVKHSDAQALERRLALAVAEVRAWRAITLQPGWTGTLPVGAMVATDADPELAKMIGGGE